MQKILVGAKREDNMINFAYWLHRDVHVDCLLGVRRTGKKNYIYACIYRIISPMTSNCLPRVLIQETFISFLTLNLLPQFDATILLPSS